MFKKYLLISFSVLLAVFLLSPIFVFAQTEKAVQYEVEGPTLQMPIPGVPQFSKIQVEDGYLDIPWLAQYISGIYKYGVALAVSLTIFMVMLGGFLRITAHGDAGKVGKANNLIVDALIGLILAIGSYVILYTINPDLVNFKAIRVEVAQRELWGDVIEEARGIEEQNVTSNVSEGTTGGKHSWSYTGFDPIFKKYAGCAGLDYRVLKGIAKKESGLNPEIVNGYGFVGLFQTKRCGKRNEKTGRYIFVHEKTGKQFSYNCNLKDPEINLRVVIDSLTKATKYIKGKCPNLSNENFLILLYLTHNSGFGSVKGAQKGDEKTKGIFDRVGCKGSEFKEATKNFWDDWNKILGRKNGPKGEKRYNYAKKVADYILSHRVKNPFAQSHGETCPW